MIHEMRLNNEPFNSIKNKTKTIEMRLYDEKRRLIKQGDLIEFRNRLNDEIIKCEVINLHVYNNFEELYKHFNPISLGYNENEIVNPSDMNKYYSEDEQQKYGVVGIEIKLVK